MRDTEREKESARARSTCDRGFDCSIRRNEGSIKALSFSLTHLRMHFILSLSLTHWSVLSLCLSLLSEREESKEGKEE